MFDLRMLKSTYRWRWRPVIALRLPASALDKDSRLVESSIIPNGKSTRWHATKNSLQKNSNWKG